ncbi:hypothetical protein EWB00_000471 [Schistosoma japonicum]|uniref:Uncharacterized protein n=1 Tax=Schistosoma japonicum TaxID=6182 RepID=A0A4Z2DIS1_SCHJA|nr:hypothetical protein EWB00_000471 [Schistosoma japonicum]
MYDQTEVEFLVNLIISTQNSARSFSNYKYDYHAINTASRFSTASTTVPLLPSPSLSSFTNYPRQKILICGLPDDISPCLDYAMIAKPGVIDYSSLIIASTDNGTLVIPSENPEWRIRYTNLMNSFTENNGTLIKLAENVFDAGFTRQIDHLLGRRHMHSRIYFGYEKPIESPQKFID